MEIPAPVSSSFCVPHETQMVIEKKSFFSPGQSTVTDEQGSLLFNMKSEGGFLSYAERRIYNYAASGEAVLLMKRKVKFCAMPKWKAFHGDGESESQLLFTMRKKSGFGVEYEVFLPGNDDSSRPDFSLKKKSVWGSRFSILSTGTPIAEVEKTGFGRVYTVVVHPGVDRAFIAAVTIIWILEQIRRQNQANAANSG